MLLHWRHQVQHIIVFDFFQNGTKNLAVVQARVQLYDFFYVTFEVVDVEEGQGKGVHVVEPFFGDLWRLCGTVVKHCIVTKFRVWNHSVKRDHLGRLQLNHRRFHLLFHLCDLIFANFISNQILKSLITTSSPIINKPYQHYKHQFITLICISLHHSWSRKAFTLSLAMYLLTLLRWKNSKSSNKSSAISSISKPKMSTVRFYLSSSRTPRWPWRNRHLKS
jgi:hypothetical protein